MRARTRLVLLLALVLPLVVAPEGGSAPGEPTPHCSPAPESCSGWYTTNVTVSWTWDAAGVTQTVGCNIDTVTSDTAGKAESCEVTYGDDTHLRKITIKRDATPPQVSGGVPERGPDSGEWYSHPVAIAFAGTDATSGIGSCDRPTYSGGDTASARVSGSCRDVAGNLSAPAAVALKYDATAPTVSAAPARKPDKKGWYRRPVVVTFTGSDATSGISSCTEPVRYKGPDGERATVAGTCRDGAGNVAPDLPVAFRYDATPPRLRGARARVAKGVARVGWDRPGDAVVVEILRTPGVNGARSTIVYRGRGETFADRTVRRGIRYRYEIRAADAAGNETAQVVTAGARDPLYAPAAGAVVKAPPRLAWEAVPGARYYNVQLRRNGVKVLSAWPRANGYRLRRTWRYAGSVQSLATGVYRWYVWPARGTRERPRYGPLIGSSSFRVR